MLQGAYQASICIWVLFYGAEYFGVPEGQGYLAATGVCVTPRRLACAAGVRGARVLPRWYEPAASLLGPAESVARRELTAEQSVGNKTRRWGC